ncbi:hypothetical protein [Burkholderia cepacia]|uniref:hypothetical protein n=1 Tax=Burkholderia cepacia TaxID=292 RepID=UPI001CF3A632|nr:hypothetical protein [Burkholderia cepacia]MCA8326186.1 hypothetical protein [Burkholderia cepacia]
MSDACAQLENRIALLSIALRAFELDEATQLALGHTSFAAIQRDLCADIRSELENAIDQWLSRNDITARKILDGEAK